MGASDPGGVQVRPHDYQEFMTKRMATIHTDKAEAITALVMSQLGKPFDDEALRQVVSEHPRDWKLPNKWFCSELMAWACEEAGLLRIIVPKNRVSPSDLLLLLNPWIDAEEFAKECAQDDWYVRALEARQ